MIIVVRGGANYSLFNIEWKELGEVFYIKNGYTPSKSVEEYWRNGEISWYRLEDIRKNGSILNDSIIKVNKLGIKGELFPENSIIMSTTATIGEYALIKEEFLCNQQFTCFFTKENYKEVFNIKFIYYYFYNISNFAKKNINNSGFANVKIDRLKKIKIPIPPLEEQERIVKILDKFEKIVNDINEGLPKEIELRQKQYEYYREKLLTFK